MFTMNYLRFEDLDIRPTLGDGSCAIHALLGKNEWGPTFGWDARGARQRLVEWVSENNRFPLNIIRDYFLHFEASPGCFQEGVREVWEQYYFEYLRFYIPGNLDDELKCCNEERRAILTLAKEVRLLSSDAESPAYREKRAQLLKIADADRVIERFVADERVRRVYLETLKRTEVCMLQDELALAAECFNKRVRLFQKGWYGDNQRLGEEILNPTGEEEVIIYFGGDHYERAFVRGK